MLNSKTKWPDLESFRVIAGALGMSDTSVFRAGKQLALDPEFPEQDDLKVVVAQLPDEERQ